MRRSYENVLLIQRVLAVLEHFNRQQVSTVRRISEECGIPPSSVVRILETLCVEGYLTHISRRGGYAVTSKIRSLSSGFHGSSWLVEVLKPWVEDLTRRHLWPFAIATLDRDAMVVQYSSIPHSPLAHVKTTLHKRLSLVSRAHGRAYIAFCTSQERRHLLRLIIGADDPENDVVANAEEWRRLIVLTRKRGYAMRAAGIDPQTSTIAVPVRLESGHVVATLGMTFFRRAVNNGKIAAYAAALKAAAADAARHIDEQILAKGPLIGPSIAPGEAPSLSADGVSLEGGLIEAQPKPRR